MATVIHCDKCDRKVREVGTGLRYISAIECKDSAGWKHGDKQNYFDLCEECYEEFLKEFIKEEEKEG